VYSVLVWRIRKQNSATITEVCNRTGLSWNSVASSLKKLEGYELVQKTEHAYLAKEPQGEVVRWFPRRQCDSTQWFDLIAYVWVPVPTGDTPALLDRAITLLESYIWSYYKTAKRSTSIRNIARMTGVSREKISVTLAKFKGLEASSGFSEDLFLTVGERKKRTVSPEAKAKMVANRLADKLYLDLGKPQVFDYLNMQKHATRKVLLPLAELCDLYNEGMKWTPVFGPRA